MFTKSRRVYIHTAAERDLLQANTVYASFSWAPCTSEGVRKMIEALRCAGSLKRLSLPKFIPTLPEDFLSQVVTACPQLEALSMHVCRTSDSQWHVLQRLVSLRTLRLHVSTKDDYTLPVATMVPSLQRLTLDGARFTRSAAMSIAGMSHLHTLELTRATGLTKKSLETIGKNRTLRSLFIDGGRITNQVVVHMAKFLRSLQKLSLHRCPYITTEGFEHVPELESLEELVIVSCDRLDDGSLQCLRSLDNLHELFVESCARVTETGMRALASSMGKRCDAIDKDTFAIE